jgi:hypothetical protein
MSSSFSTTELGISPNAHLEDAYLYQGYGSPVSFSFKWEQKVKDEFGNAHWITQGLSLSAEQARALYEALGHMLNTEVDDEGSITWVVNDGELEEKFQEKFQVSA